MTAHLRNLLLTWVLLLVLLAAEFGASFLPLERIERPLILIPVGLMVMTVGTMFMQVGRGPLIVRLFVVAGLVWLGILLGLGSLDPMTRADYLVQTANPNLHKLSICVPQSSLICASGRLSTTLSRE